MFPGHSHAAVEKKNQEWTGNGARKKCMTCQCFTSSENEIKFSVLHVFNMLHLVCTQQWALEVILDRLFK